MRIEVYDVSGRRVTTLLDGIPGKVGYNQVLWDGTTGAGGPAASRVYFCRMTAHGREFTRKMVLVR